MSESAPSGYMGEMQPNSSAAPTNAQAFFVQALINRIATTALVKVVSVTNAGGIEPVGFVNVQILVNQVDGFGQPTPHGTLHSLPYFRLQGGADAIILDPAVGDIGIAMFCSRDISNVKANKAQSNPGSLRKYDWADGLYIGGVLNGVPTQYIAFAGDTIEIRARQHVSIAAPGSVSIDTPYIETTGEVRALGQVTGKYGTGNSVTTTNHTHPSNGAPPTPGT